MLFILMSIKGTKVWCILWSDILTTFEQVLVPLLQNIDNLKKHKQLVDAKEAFVNESWDLVKKADKQITRGQAEVDEAKA